jgi:hypothetical protein
MQAAHFPEAAEQTVVAVVVMVVMVALMLSGQIFLMLLIA